MTDWLLLEDVRAFGGLRLAGTILDDTKVDVQQIINDGAQVLDLSLYPLSPTLQRIVDENTNRRMKGLSGLDLTNIFAAIAEFAKTGIQPPPVLPSVPSVIWRPGLPSSGYFLESWAEVYNAVTANQGNLTVFVDALSGATEAEVPIGNGLGWPMFQKVAVKSGHPATDLVSEIYFEPGAFFIDPYLFSAMGVKKEHTGGHVIEMRAGGRLFFDEATVVYSTVGIDEPIILCSAAACQILMSKGSNIYTETFAPTRGLIQTPGGVFLVLALTSQLGATFFPHTLEGTPGDFALTITDSTAKLPPQLYFPNSNIFPFPVAKAEYLTPAGGATRPATPDLYMPWFDATIGKPIWWDGAAWRLADGTLA